MTPWGDRPVTIEHVASRAGVSVATVSRALRGLPNVAPSTRARVQQVASELEYVADPSASRLATGRTRTVAMAVPMLDSWYFSKVMAGAEAALAAAGYDLLVFTVDSEESRRRVLSGPLFKRADGVILVDLRLPDEEGRRLVGSGAAVASIGFEIAGASSVMVDDVRIGTDATDHLIGLGHRSIGLMQLTSDDPLRFAVPERRRLGYHHALKAAGLSRRPEFEVTGSSSVDGGGNAMAALLDLDSAPTAVFAMSDEMAFGAYRELRARGKNTPTDMSIIGVDDHEFSEVIGLTTIQQEVHQHGAAAAGLVLSQLNGDRGSQKHESETTIVVRSSTAALG